LDEQGQKIFELIANGNTSRAAMDDKSTRAKSATQIKNRKSTVPAASGMLSVNILSDLHNYDTNVTQLCFLMSLVRLVIPFQVTSYSSGQTAGEDDDDASDGSGDCKAGSDGGARNVDPWDMLATLYNDNNWVVPTPWATVDARIKHIDPSKPPETYLQGHYLREYFSSIKTRYTKLHSNVSVSGKCMTNFFRNENIIILAGIDSVII
jgi:hypothetical protein